MINLLTFFDLFSGIGAFRLALERNGFKYSASCEIDKYARKVYAKNFGSLPQYEDVRDIEPSKLDKFDILTAGFPCQSFSNAGKRMGFNDIRGTMFFEIARIAQEIRPKILFLENVKGLLNHDSGRTFSKIIDTIQEMGYDLEWQVINGKYFVPQNRERIFIIGHLRDSGFRKVFPITESGQGDDGTCKEAQGEGEWFRGTYRGCLSAESGRNSHKYVRTIDSNYRKGGGSRTMVQDHVRTIDACYHKVGPHGSLIKPLTEKRTEQAKEERRRIKQETGKDYCKRRDKVIEERIDGLVGCLTASESVDRYLKDDTRIRRLTPLECERLMGFPDSWTECEGISETQRYKMLGNSIIVNVIDLIANHINLYNGHVL